MIKYLTKLADHLDKNGHIKEADFLDLIIKKLADGPDIMVPDTVPSALPFPEVSGESKSATPPDPELKHQELKPPIRTVSFNPDGSDPFGCTDESRDILKSHYYIGIYQDHDGANKESIGNIHGLTGGGLGVYLEHLKQYNIPEGFSERPIYFTNVDKCPAEISGKSASPKIDYYGVPPADWADANPSDDDEHA